MSDIPSIIVEQHNADAEAPVEVLEGEAVEEEKVEGEEDQMGSRFAALARREKALVDRERQMKTDYEAKEAAWKEKDEKYSSYSGMDEALKEDPLKWLESKGLSYSNLTDRALGIEAEEQSYDPRSEIQALRDELKQRDEASEQSKKDAEEQAVKDREAQGLSDYRGQIDTVVDDNEKYELINIKGAKDDVVQTAIEYYNKFQKLLSAEEAADMVEEYLTTEAQKYMKANKFTKKELDMNEALEANSPSLQANVPKTLTNSNSSGNNPIAPQTTRRRMTEEESKREAAKLLNWN